eukprot:Clim_evm35s235 gene=Clim_evmTU35s235
MASSRTVLPAKLVQFTNIAPIVKEHHVRELLEYIGEVERMDIIPTFPSQGELSPKTAYIEFKRANDGDICLHLTGTVLFDRSLIVGRLKKWPELDKVKHAKVALPAAVAASAGMSKDVFLNGKRESGTAESDPERRIEAKKMIYVGNLPSDITPLEMWDHFSAIGDVNFARVNGEPGTDPRFGFIEFTSEEAAVRAMNYDENLRGRRLKKGPCKHFIKKPLKTGDSWLFHWQMNKQHELSGVLSMNQADKDDPDRALIAGEDLLADKNFLAERQTDPRDGRGRSWTPDRDQRGNTYRHSSRDFDRNRDRHRDHDRGGYSDYRSGDQDDRYRRSRNDRDSRRENDQNHSERNSPERFSEVDPYNDRMDSRGFRHRHDNREQRRRERMVDERDYERDRDRYREKREYKADRDLDWENARNDDKDRDRRRRGGRRYSRDRDGSRDRSRDRVRDHERRGSDRDRYRDRKDREHRHRDEYEKSLSRKARQRRTRDSDRDGNHRDASLSPTSYGDRKRRRRDSRSLEDVGAEQVYSESHHSLRHPPSRPSTPPAHEGRAEPFDQSPVPMVSSAVVPPRNRRR